MKNKWWALVLALSFLLGSSIPAGAEEGRAFEEEYQIALALGLIGAEKAYEQVVTLDGLDQVLRDCAKVASSHADGDRPATFQEAVTAMVKLCGYEVSVKGDKTERDYLSKAAELKLLSGVSAYQDQDVTYGILSRFLYNAAQVDMLRLSFGTEEYTSEKGISYLENNLKIFHTKGDVTDIVSISYDGSQKLVKIDGFTYYPGEVELSGLLGRRVEFYAREQEDDNAVLLYIRTNSQTKPLVLTDMDEVVYSAGTMTFTYAEPGGRTKTLRLSSDARVLYNGQLAASLTEEDFSEQNFTSGEITLYDDDNDGRYEIVHIWSYQTYRVYAVNAQEETITYETAKEKGKIDLHQISDSDRVEIYRNGSRTDLSGLKQGDILSVAVDKSGRYYTMHAVDYVVSDTISAAVQESGGRLRYTVGEDTYYASQAYNALCKEKLSAGYSGVFYLDHFGKIAFFELKATSNGGYALVVKWIYREAEETASVLLVNETGMLSEYKVARKVSFDGGKAGDLEVLSGQMRTLLDAYQAGEKPVLAEYSINNLGEVSRIKLIPCEKQFKNKSWPYRAYTINTNDINNMVFLKDETLIFHVYKKYPDDEQKKYSVTQGNSLSSGQVFEGDIYTYNVDKDMQSDVVIYLGGASAPLASQTHKVYSRADDVIIEDGELGKQIYYYDGIAENSILVRETEVEDVKGLKPGDVFIFSTDPEGYLSNIKLNISRKDMDSGSRGKFVGSTWWGDSNRVIIGTVDERSGNGMLLINWDTGSGNSKITAAPVSQNTVIFKYVYSKDGEFLRMDYGSLEDLKPNTTVAAKTSNGSLVRVIVGNVFEKE